MFYRSSTAKRFLLASLAILHILAAIASPSLVSAADGDVVGCTPDFNISQSPDNTSADPFLVADPTGLVHLFWAELLPGSAGASNVPDTLMYSVWNGTSWSTPVDLFLSPPEFFNRRVMGIRAVLDDERVLHLLWQGPDYTLYYSQAPADEAGNARAWKPELQLTREEAGAQFSSFIAYEPPSTLHIAYGQGTSNTENRSVVYIRSTDRGVTWSEPIELIRMAAPGTGPSNVRLLVGQPGDVYASWTEWDMTGNGQAIYFTRSSDSGLTWADPIVLDRRQGEEYERDWSTLALLGENALVAFWEGGFRAYRQAQYSYDGGATWTDPIDTLDWLIADNGFAEFARDSAGRLHLFVLQRVREGNVDKGRREGLWHTMWEGNQQWREPELVGSQTPANLVSVAISGGNQLFAATTGTFDYEIHIRRCTIQGAPAIAPQLPVTEATSPDTDAGTLPVVEATPPVSSGEPEATLPAIEFSQTPVNETDPGSPLILGIAAPLFLVAITVAGYVLRRRP